MLTVSRDARQFVQDDSSRSYCNRFVDTKMSGQTIRLIAAERRKFGLLVNFLLALGSNLLMCADWVTHTVDLCNLINPPSNYFCRVLAVFYFLMAANMTESLLRASRGS